GCRPDSMNRRFQCWSSCCAIVSLSIDLGAAGPDYDLVIRRGKIVDGSGNPWFHGDVAVKGDRIVAIGRVDGDAKGGIDATALVVVHGLIATRSDPRVELLEAGDVR